MVARALLLLLLVPGTLAAAPAGCSFAAADENDVWLLLPEQAPRKIYTAEPYLMVAAWSPDGRRVALGSALRSGVQGIVIIDLAGVTLGGFRIEHERFYLRLRDLESLHWPNANTLVSYGSVGPNGGFMDLWSLSPDLRRARHRRRAMILGHSCEESRSLRYVACVGGGTVTIYDTLLTPDDDGVVWDEEAFRTPDPRSMDESEGVEGGLVWDGQSDTVRAVIASVAGKYLTTVERHPGAADGWRVTDREIVGIDSRVVSIDHASGGRLLLSTHDDDTRRPGAYWVDADGVPAGAVIAARPADLSSLKKLDEIAIPAGKEIRRARVLATYCSDAPR